MTSSFLSTPPEMALVAPSKLQRAALGVFSDNRRRPIHRWYPFVEGYSADLVMRALDATGDPPTIFDPFGGSGTTALAASLVGFDSYFCEVNPYLAWVADVKVNKSSAAFHDPALCKLVKLAEMLEEGFRPSGPVDHPLLRVDRRRQFFPPGVAQDATGLLDWIGDNFAGPIAELATLACTTSLIPSSNMIRRTDLRRRRSGDPSPRRLLPEIAAQLRIFHSDVVDVGLSLTGVATKIGSDVRSLSRPPDRFELIVTSPPYLNGTNYCRNTKLELLALGLMASEDDLASLRADSITAGINNVSARLSEPDEIASVQDVAGRLDVAAYDQRIPRLVRQYFSDMRRAFAAIRQGSKAGAKFLLDIGDSRFAGIHVPTHELMVDVAAMERWRLESTEALRVRRSHDGHALSQVLLELRAT
jgi:hypothetical protein